MLTLKRIYSRSGVLHTAKKETTSCVKWSLIQEVNPLSPDSDQHQFSPNNIHMLPREMIMRVKKMITKEKML